MHLKSLNWMWVLVCAGIAAVSSVIFSAGAQTSEARREIESFAIGVDQLASWPRQALLYWPDEHTTFMPLGGGEYLVFGAASVDQTGGAVVLTTQGLPNFPFALGRGFQRPVMRPFAGFTVCRPGGAAANPGFDENYAAPGSVVQDPTRPPGNFIMIYEAENHCPQGRFDPNYYATVGFARSSDGGRHWPPASNTALGARDRYPALIASTSEQSLPPYAAGDAIPSALVDGSYLYVVYEYYSGRPSSAPIDQIRVARAELGVDRPIFYKWNNGWSGHSPGQGGLDTPVLPRVACNGRTINPSIARDDDLGLYLMIFVCWSDVTRRAAWYYATATSLDAENWSVPRLIPRSEGDFTPCAGGASHFDGFYPSLVSPGAPAGHVRSEGYVFFLRGCETSAQRDFVARTFSLRRAAPLPPNPTRHCGTRQTCCEQGARVNGRCS